MTDNIDIDEEYEDENLNLWVIVRCNTNLFGFDAGLVGNMIVIPKITHVPDGLDYLPGTITVRGSIIPLIDFRIYTGQTAVEQETDDFCQLMDQRLGDHQNWIKELKASVDEKRDFKLATNPHKCAFGKWYDNYSSEDRTVTSILAKFDAPHRVIHGIAEKVTKLVHENKIDEAHEIIDNTSGNELSQMVALFTEVKEAVIEISKKRIAMVLELEENTIALDIDEVVAVENITNIEDAPKNESSSIGVSRIGRRDKTDDLVLLMDSLEF